MRIVIAVIVLMFALMLLIFSKPVMAAATGAFELFIQSVFPALFPFLTCTLVLKKADVLAVMGTNRFTRGIVVFVISAASGCPMGTMLVDSTFGHMRARRKTCLCAAMNMSSPMFIFGTIANRFLPFSGTGWLIAASHYVSGLILASIIILSESAERYCGSCIAPSAVKKAARPLQLLHSAIPDAIQIMFNVGGTIIFFSIVICVIESLGMFNGLSAFGRGVIFGIFEMTNGVSCISNAAGRLVAKCCAVAGILSFGGICILMQAKSTGAAIDTFAYIGAKLMHAGLAMLICYILFPLFVDGSQPVFSSLDVTQALERSVSALEIAICVVITVCASTLTANLVSRKSGI